MDLARAKSIVIALLVAFNLFLLFNNFSYYREKDVPRETIKNAEAILKARGITLECGIPKTPAAARWLRFNGAELDRAEITKMFLDGPEGAEDNGGKRLLFLSGVHFLFTDSNGSGGISGKNDKEIGNSVKAYLKGKGLLNGGYVVDGLVREPDGKVVVTFIEKYNGFFLYDNYCVATITAGGVTRLEYSKLRTEGFPAGKVGDSTAAYQALLAHFREGENSVVTSIVLGYKYPDDYSAGDMETVELLPVWRVKIKGLPDPEYLGAVDIEK